jgi:hypothetical protein
MTPDLQREFQSLSARAKQQLKDVPISGSYRHLFSLWIMPSFSSCRRCTVYSPSRSAKGQQPFASFAIWRSDLDSEKLASPVERLKYPKDLAPTIEDDVLRLTNPEVEQIEQRICGVSVPLYLGRSSVAGCDGTCFEFRYDELFFGVEIHWWENHPAAWRPFTEAVTRIVGELEARRQHKVQPGATPNGGPAMPVGNSGATQGPPSVR